MSFLDVRINARIRENEVDFAYNEKRQFCYVWKEIENNAKVFVAVTLTSKLFMHISILLNVRSIKSNGETCNALLCNCFTFLLTRRKTRCSLNHAKKYPENTLKEQW